MHDQSHAVLRLPVHLPDEQRVYFREGDEQAALQRGENHTKLTAWFVLNQNDENARRFLYADIPYHFVFNQQQKRWVVRQRGAEKIVSRMYNASIREGERYFLRVLLLHVPGATSFEYLRTVNGIVYRSYREACLALGLLADDALWERTLNELVESASPSKIRKSFSFILIHGEPSNPAELWQMFRAHMIEDFLRHQNEADAEQSALGKIQEVLQEFGKVLNDFNLPNLEQALAQDLPDVEGMREQAQNLRVMLNPIQTGLLGAPQDWGRIFLSPLSFLGSE